VMTTRNRLLLELDLRLEQLRQYVALHEKPGVLIQMDESQG
jgi:hypothetical protein